VLYFLLLFIAVCAVKLVWSAPAPQAQAALSATQDQSPLSTLMFGLPADVLSALVDLLRALRQLTHG
jgi:hypothetical protein